MPASALIFVKKELNQMSQNNYKPAIECLQEAPTIKNGIKLLVWEILKNDPSVITRNWAKVKKYGGNK